MVPLRVVPGVFFFGLRFEGLGLFRVFTFWARGI